jgi:hypothetical protein
MPVPDRQQKRPGYLTKKTKSWAAFLLLGTSVVWITLLFKRAEIRSPVQIPLGTDHFVYEYTWQGPEKLLVFYRSTHHLEQAYFDRSTNLFTPSKPDKNLDDQTQVLCKQSPNGKWLVWPDDGQWKIASATGTSTQQTISKETTGEMPLREGVHPVFCSTKHLQSLQVKYRFPIYRTLTDRTWFSEAGFTGLNQFVVAYHIDGSPQKFHLREYSLTSSALPVHAASFSGEAGNIVEVALSPNGKKIAWMQLDWEDPVPWPVMLYYRWMPSALTESRLSFWECRLDGSQKHIISRQTIHMGVLTFFSDTHRSITPHNLQWSPDGKQLSFLREGNLWVVPLDQ